MRIFINLFSPKLIGQYFNEKLARVIFYVLFFLAICFIPTAVEMDKKAVVSYTDDIALIQDFKNKEASNLKIENNILEDKTIASYSGETYSVVFNTAATDESKKITLAFSNDFVNIVYYKNIIKTVKYSTLDDSSLDVSLIQNGDFKEIHKLFNYITMAENVILDNSRTVDYLYNIVYVALPFLLVILFLAYIGKVFNPILPFNIRFNIAAYASTWAYVSYFIGVLTGYGALFYVGAIVSFIFNSIAVKQIVKAERSQ